MLCCTMHCQWGSKLNSKNCPFQPEEDRATAIGNMYKNGKDHTCDSEDMLAGRQTDRHIHT